MSGCCDGNVGANSVATVPFGRSRPRYSPLALRLKSVCSSAPGTARFFPDANRIRIPFAVKFVEGKSQRAACVGSSVRAQPARLTFVALVLYISIQSEN